MVAGNLLAQWRRDAQSKAIAAGISPAEVDWLLQEVAGLDRLALRLESFSTTSLPVSLAELNTLWEKRLLSRVPVQYLVGRCHWRRFSLEVSPDVLIPRPETEEIVELAFAAAQNSPTPHLDTGIWVDLGTGSGAIAIGLADILTNAQIYAVDLSASALNLAKKNATNLGFEERINFSQGSWWEPLSHLQGKVAGIVSNPPYIPTLTLPQLQPEVVQHEPHLALDGGKDGLASIRYLVQSSPQYLVSGGVWLIEMMAGQAEEVTHLLQQQGSYSNMQIFPDLAGIERFALAYRC
ncbi:peptide chain release factor N(5)-glutamine methyltransferase [Oscillatoria salina]|uniref:peptide chain release factor N(5)-glutamine methyltransferase n=1 Tax=Oscillatoria salina TaxID=331517 RepID=UPI0013B6E543|nr:peptide chain release factor N(5)-glutamine methyltransferase [Oscillatoria salina]MBZ8183018.1 peptide chain release factor N(5)-glutamine methyltransferase [Oscillatoria salina IIICB1]NET86621.1 peptide chain release factor N(5)-glutamine methyltransferase [Kamptonema sp. SIO1D9]